jgi:hypothetical protein
VKVLHVCIRHDTRRKQHSSAHVVMHGVSAHWESYGGAHDLCFLGLVGRAQVPDSLLVLPMQRYGADLNYRFAHQHHCVGIRRRTAAGEPAEFFFHFSATEPSALEGSVAVRVALRNRPADQTTRTTPKLISVLTSTTTTNSVCVR